MSRFSIFVVSMAALNTGLAFAETDDVIAIEADANHCELYIDDFRIQTTAAYGASTIEMVAKLTTRYGDVVQQVGGRFRYHEKSSKTNFGEAGRPLKRVEFEGERVDIVIGSSGGERRFDVPLKINWQHYDDETGSREPLSFSYFVDLKVGEITKRLWLNDSGHEFTADDFDKDKYSFSTPVFLGGYSGGVYLWRDSGSPLFAKRVRCVR